MKTNKIIFLMGFIFFNCFYISLKAIDYPLEIDVTKIRFNYDLNSYSEDALSIKFSALSFIIQNEWLNDGISNNHPFAYIKGQTNRKIKVTFRHNQDQSQSYNFVIGAAAAEGTSFGDVPYATVSFPSYNNGYSAEKTFQLNGTVPNSVGKRYVKFAWWCVNEALSMGYTGNHYYYTLLAAPQEPMSVPWIEVLDYACSWAYGTNSSENACINILNNGFKEHYTWNYQCHRLSSDFVRLVSSLGIYASQHNWASKNLYTGDMAYQRTISIDPVGPTHGQGTVEWSWHQWSEAVSSQRDPSAGVSVSGFWGTYEDYLFSNYLVKGGNWTANQPGQSSGCEAPDKRYYTNSPTLYSWYGPSR